MPVEIRELVIKTNITSSRDRDKETLSPEKLNLLKQQIMQECLRELKDRAVKNSFDR
jgi:hypothetical protein